MVSMEAAAAADPEPLASSGVVAHHGPHRSLVALTLVPDPISAYKVVVFDLANPEYREAYLRFHDAIENARYWAAGARIVISTSGFAHSPNRDTIDTFSNPVVAVCSLDTDGRSFPAPESIVAFVVVSRLIDADGTTVVLMPMGLTKTPVGFGASYQTDIVDAVQYNELTLRPHDERTVSMFQRTPGRVWATNVAPRMFMALTTTYSKATLLTRFATSSIDVVNPFITRLANNTFPGRTSVGYAMYVGLEPAVDVHMFDALVKSWFLKPNKRRSHISVPGIADGALVRSAKQTPIRPVELAAFIRVIGVGNDIAVDDVMGRKHTHTLSQDDMDTINKLNLDPIQPEWTPPTTKIPGGFVPSRLVVDDVAKTLVIHKTTTAISYDGHSRFQRIFDSPKLFDLLGMLFCVYPPE